MEIFVTLEKRGSSSTGSRFWRLLLVLLFCHTTLLAEEGKAVRVQFLAQVLPAGIEQVLMATEEQRTEAFALPTHHLSEALEVPARQFSLRTVEEEQSLGEIRLPDQGSDFIVLLVLGEQAGYTPIIIPSKDRTFEIGQVYAYNSSKQTILGQVGSFQFALPPKKAHIIKPAGAIENRYYNVTLAVRKAENEPLRLLNTSRWPTTSVRRSFLFFFDDPERNSVTFRAVDE